jgi:hypothetical protein
MSLHINRRTLLAAAALAALPARAQDKGSQMDDAVFELRQYTLFGGRRDELITLFEREFVEPQNVLGAHVLGTFRDLDDPDRFVWLRGFQNMETRRQALTSFYTGPVWRAHRTAANATMVDSDNVLLLRAATPAKPFGASASEPGVLAAHIHYVGGIDPSVLASFFEEEIRPDLTKLGFELVALLTTEPAENNFPQLPVREGEPVFIWITRFPNEAAERAAASVLAKRSGWRDNAPRALLPALARKPEVLRLSPTRTSRVR